jgi:uncharacterized 2Fe-2S/4Fe-4S cluster protein (DUF4445 family)
MGQANDKMFSVRFDPMGLKVHVSGGSTLLDAAHQADIYVSSICGGDGYCGKCKLIVNEGSVQNRPASLLSPDEIDQNIVLACQTKVSSDMTVTVPKWHGLETGHILAESDTIHCRQTKNQIKGPGFSADPLVRKVFLQMSAPTIHDHTADHERLYLAIRQKADTPIIQTGFRVLQKLSSVMKGAEYEVTATIGRRGATTELIEIEAKDRTQKNYAVAVDLGTTTVVAHLVDLKTQATVVTEAVYNSQINFGDDYIRRIIYAEENDAFDLLQDRIVHDVNDLIATLATRQRIGLNDITVCTVAGNTAMIHFLLKLDPTRIRREPYVASADFVPPIRAVEAGIQINKRGLLYCLPSVGAYVGGDIVAGVLATGMYDSDKLALLVDIGTNGEVVLGNREWMMCASSSAGPAFEGSGVRHGMRAVKGAIEQLRINSHRGITWRTIGDSPPMGLCGSGLLDTIAELHLRDVIDRTGRFRDLSDRRLTEGDEGLQFQLVPAAEERPEVVITQIDINNLIRSKAGVFAAIRALMQATGTGPKDLDAVYLAGGFGNFLNIRHAVRIGMLPDVSLEKIWFVGNTSIMGSKAALLSYDALRRSEQIAESMTYVDLMSDPDYMEEFIRASFLPHTDLSLFPSVGQEAAETRTKRS